MATKKCKDSEKKKDKKDARPFKFECKNCGSTAKKGKRLCKPKKA